MPARNRATNSAKAVSERWALWPKPPKPQTRSVALVQVEIPSKPTPVYTDEARRLHLEGEVTVEVVFAASGELRVLRILKGLDEAALRAATGIRFKPARRDDLPVDTVATLHIVFQLAN
ncbi:MAG TPA: energy transducer TonB [Terriglobia bacterium]|nr:energy transducer TonB [Terriglobia bacterium]